MEKTLCNNCGYDMHDRKHGDLCPECGKQLDLRRTVPKGEKYANIAIMYLSFGILALALGNRVGLLPFMGLMLSILFVGVGCLYSSKVLRKTTYHSTPYAITKRLKIVSVLMWVYGIEFFVLVAISNIL